MIPALTRNDILCACLHDSVQLFVFPEVYTLSMFSHLYIGLRHAKTSSVSVAVVVAGSAEQSAQLYERIRFVVSLSGREAAVHSSSY